MRAQGIGNKRGVRNCLCQGLMTQGGGKQGAANNHNVQWFHDDLFAFDK
jgi:hypothetical protein